MEQAGEIVRRQREYFRSGRTRPLEFRLKGLERLRKGLLAREGEIVEALHSDLGKSPFEAYATEIGIVLGEISHVRRHLASWMRARKVRTPVIHFPSRSAVLSEPYGVALVMSPWNYPVQLTLSPLVGSIAAGNCTVVKPSAYAPAVSGALAGLLREIFPPEYVAVVEGGREENQALLSEKFDYIFFTGSTSVGRTVMEAASRHLTPVTLELGGKSPCIVDETADMDLAARRVVWGKCINAGQTCIAPDYLWIHPSVKQSFLERAASYIRAFYGENPLKNPELPRIVNEKHFRRLQGLLHSGTVAAGGRIDEAALKMEPTILDCSGWDAPVMQEEIFGPILPVLEFTDIEEILGILSEKPKPLALYFFSTDKGRQRRVLSGASFGGGCVNDTIVHIASSDMPFGGVGESGMGSYHGKASFDTFSHRKSVLVKSNLLDIPTRYPPYGGKLALIKRLLA